MSATATHKSVFVKSRIDSGLKEEASAVLEDCGLSVSAAMRIFLEQVVINQGLPFTVARTPSEMSRRALLETRTIEEGFDSIDALIEGLDSVKIKEKATEH